MFLLSRIGQEMRGQIFGVTWNDNPPSPRALSRMEQEPTIAKRRAVLYFGMTRNWFNLREAAAASPAAFDLYLPLAVIACGPRSAALHIRTRACHIPPTIITSDGILIQNTQTGQRAIQIKLDDLFASRRAHPSFSI